MGGETEKQAKQHRDDAAASKKKAEECDTKVTDFQVLPFGQPGFELFNVVQFLLELSDLFLLV